MKSELKRVANLVKQPYVPVHEDPVQELRRLSKERRATLRTSTALHNMSHERKMREGGEVIPCLLPHDQCVELWAREDSLKLHAKHLEGAMLKNLKRVPIYQVFLSKVFGLGPATCAELVGYLDPAKSCKVSQMRRYCGLAVINGRLEKGTEGETRGYNESIRTALFLAFGSMWRLGNSPAKGIVQSKYLDIWRDYKNRMANSERVTDKGKIVNGQEKTVSAKGFVHSTGWHKAADVMIEDYYVVGRAMLGLDVWPSYHAAKLGYSHGGKVCVNEPRFITIDEALECVGDVSGHRGEKSAPITAPESEPEALEPCEDGAADWIAAKGE